MLIESRKRIDEHHEHFYKKLENIKKEPAITEITHMRRNWQQPKQYRRMHNWSQRQNNGNCATGTVKRKNFKQMKMVYDYLWDNCKHTNICLIEVSEEEKNKEKEVKNVSNEIMAKNFPSLRRETDTQVQEA